MYQSNFDVGYDSDVDIIFDKKNDINDNRTILFHESKKCNMDLIEIKYNSTFTKNWFSYNCYDNSTLLLKCNSEPIVDGDSDRMSDNNSDQMNISDQEDLLLDKIIAFRIN